MSTTRRDEVRRRRSAILELACEDAPIDELFARIVEFVAVAAPDTPAAIASVRGDRLRHEAASALLGRRHADLVDGLAIVPGGSPWASAAHGGRPVVAANVATDCAWPDGRRFARTVGYVACWAAPVASRDGDVRGVLALYARDAREPSPAEFDVLIDAAKLAGLVMERAAFRAQFERLAMRDALTDLPNRAHFEAELREVVSRERIDERHVGVALIDLDRFKALNDKLGHAAGDRLIADVAARLQRGVRDGDSLARMSEDEFALLMPDAEDREHALGIVRAVLATLDAPFYSRGTEVSVRASAGVAMFPDDGAQPERLLRVAERGLAAAKAGGGAAATSARTRHRPIASSIAVEAALRRAIEHGELEPHYQAVCDLTSREACGAEALLRWKHPRFGRLPTSAIVRVAEESGLIMPIGAWMLATACRQAVKWRREGGPAWVAVNVSPRQFEDARFVDIVERTLRAEKLDPRMLHLEITESVVMRDPESAAAILRTLKGLGVEIVLDDFGAGYSSLGYLKRFPIDALKIDAMFLRDIDAGGHGPRDEGIVRAIVALADALGLGTIAEGVENEAQIAFLRRLGCTLGQGFALGRPAPASVKGLGVTASAADR